MGTSRVKPIKKSFQTLRFHYQSRFADRHCWQKDTSSEAELPVDQLGAGQQVSTYFACDPGLFLNREGSRPHHVCSALGAKYIGTPVGFDETHGHLPFTVVWGLGLHHLRLADEAAFQEV